MRRTACIGFLACGLAVVASAWSVAQVPGPGPERVLIERFGLSAARS